YRRRRAGPSETSRSRNRCSGSRERPQTGGRQYPGSAATGQRKDRPGAGSRCPPCPGPEAEKSRVRWTKTTAASNRVLRHLIWRIESGDVPPAGVHEPTEWSCRGGVAEKAGGGIRLRAGATSPTDSRPESGRHPAKGTPPTGTGEPVGPMGARTILTCPPARGITDSAGGVRHPAGGYVSADGLSRP